MTIERPMFPPRAESVDSFSYLPAIRQPERAKLSSESGKPAEGLSRRILLGAIAVFPVAPATAIDLPDPAFALIAAKRAADIVHGDACDALNRAETRYGVGSDEAHDEFERGGPACEAAMQAGWPLATTPPTSLAGIVAVLHFINEVEDRGEEWPNIDIGHGDWNYRLRATIATAIEAIICKGGA